jgi:hypothetical protein
MFDGPSRSERAARAAILDERGPAWYRSLYWRAAISLIALIAVLLAAEATTLPRLAPKGGALPRDPSQMALLVASDVSAALKVSKDLDLRQHLRDEYGHFYQTILVVLRGRPHRSESRRHRAAGARVPRSAPSNAAGAGGSRFFGRGAPHPTAVAVRTSRMVATVRRPRGAATLRHRPQGPPR